VAHSTFAAANRREARDILERKLSNLERQATAANSNRVDTSADLEQLRLELDALLAYEAEGARLRSHISQLDTAENPAALLFQADRRQKVQHCLSKLNINGIVSKESKVILKECVSFYKDLYQEQVVDEFAFNPRFDGLPTLDPLARYRARATYRLRNAPRLCSV